jgi:hypothetical protein
MGFIRGVLLVLVTVLLFLSIICVNLFWTLSLSLDYKNVEKEALAVSKDFLKEINVTSAVKQAYPLINSYCKNHSEYVFNYQGYTFDIPCDAAVKGEDAVIEEGVRDLVKNVYYTEYECDFLECASKPQIPLFLISEKAYDFFTGKFYFFLAALFILLIFVFLFVEKKTNVPILAGSLLIISSLIFIKLDSLFALFSDKIILSLLKIFFSQTYFVSLRILIIGIALVLLGIVLKIFKVGFFVSKLISKVNQKKIDISKKKSVKKKSK